MKFHVRIVYISQDIPGLQGNSKIQNSKFGSGIDFRICWLSVSPMITDTMIYINFLIFFYNFVDIEFKVLKMRANYSAPLKIFYYKFSECENVFETLVNFFEVQTIIKSSDIPSSKQFLKELKKKLTRLCLFKFKLSDLSSK